MKLGILLAALAATPVSAAVYTQTYTGTIASGWDYAGIFGASGADLTGQYVLQSYEYDTERGNRFTAQGTDYLSGSIFDNNLGPITRASVTINGITRTLSPTRSSSVGFYTVFGEDFTDSFVFGSAQNLTEFIGSSLRVEGVDSLPSSIDSTYNINGQLESGARFVENNLVTNFQVIGVNSTVRNIPLGNDPKTYGLFIGVKDFASLETSADFRGDLGAQILAERFDALGVGPSILLIGDRTISGGVEIEDIERALGNIRGQMTGSDKLFLYITGHGESEFGYLADGSGDENILLGQNKFTGLLKDDKLVDLLEPFEDFQKLILLDACHAGGFWDTKDLAELSGGPNDLFDTDLAALKRISMISSSSEVGLSYYDDPLHIPIISRALSEYWLDPNSQFASTDSIYQSIYDYAVASHNMGDIVYEMEFGSPTLFARTLITAESFRSADANFRFAPGVPEPGTWLLMIAGFGLVGTTMRRRAIA